MVRHLCAWIALAALSLSAVACAAEAADETLEAETTSATPGASFETQQGPDGAFTFDLVATNGHHLLHSVPFATKEEADRGIQTALAIGTDARRYETAEAEAGFSFTLKAEGGEALATSEVYSSKPAADRGARTTRALIREVRESLRPSRPAQNI